MPGGLFWFVHNWVNKLKYSIFLRICHTSVLGTASCLLNTKGCFAVQGCEWYLWQCSVNILSIHHDLHTELTRTEVHLFFLPFFLFWCWEVIYFFANDITKSWVTVIPDFSFGEWGNLISFGTETNRLFQYSFPDYWTRLLIDDGIQRVDEKTSVRIVVLVSAPVGSNARWTQLTDKSGRFGKLTDVLISYTHQKQRVMAFPGSPRFSRLRSVRFMLGINKDLFWWTGKSSFPLGLK